MNLSPGVPKGRSNSQALQSVETVYNPPWGLSDEKPDQSKVVVDTMSNLAGNIHRFEIKRRLMKNQSHQKRVRMRSNTDKNDAKRADSQYRIMVDDYRRRIHQYESCEKTSADCLKSERFNRPQPEKKQAPPAPRERKSAELKSIEVKFGPTKKHNRSTSENFAMNIGEKFLSNIRARILSRKQSMRRQDEPLTSRPQSKELKELKDLANRLPVEQQLGFLNVNKLMPHGLKLNQARKLRIFDMEEFTVGRRNEGRAQYLPQCRPEFADLAYELQPRITKPLTGCVSDRSHRQIMLPR